jgi:AAHS family 3-hydroxyphenylpropionic acid transporter
VFSETPSARAIRSPRIRGGENGICELNAMIAQPSSHRVAVILAFCFLAALCEGYDVQAAGIAASGIARDFGATSTQLGLFFSAGSFGLMLGAVVGGRLADRIGRKRVLVASIGTFGLFALATAFASDMQSLTWMRVLTGFGLGGAMPNLIALASEVSRESSRNVAIATTYIGMPLGGTMASVTVALIGPEHWRSVFWIGGATPLVIALAMAACMPGSLETVRGVRAGDDVGQIRKAATFANDLFGDRRLRSTLVLWAGFFLCVLTLHLLLNWLPLLLQARGLSATAAAYAQAAFNIGGAAGGLLTGALLDTRWRWACIAVNVVALPLIVLLLATSPERSQLMIGFALLLGSAVLSVQVILYGVAGVLYAPSSRGTGMGAAVGIGRIGSIAGPAFAALLIGAGRTPTQVLLGVLPIVVTCGLAAAVLGRRHYRSDVGPPMVTGPTPRGSG